MRFADVVGHGPVIEMLRRTAFRDHVAHAWLFHGPEGVGKRTVAMAFLSYLVCRNRTEEDSCGRCLSCRQVDEGLFPDIRVLAPDGLFIKMEQVQEAMPRLFFPPVVGPVKGLVLDDAHHLKPEAANAALKTLEEPPPGVVFILVSSAPDLLPRTVVSRCFPVAFGRLARDEVRGLLQARGIPEATARAAASVARGSPGLAMRMAQTEGLADGADLLASLLEMPHATARFQMIEDLGRDRESAALRMAWIECLIRDLLRVATGLPESECAHPEMHGRMQALVDRVGTDAVLEMAEAFLAWDRDRSFSPSLSLALQRILQPLSPR